MTYPTRHILIAIALVFQTASLPVGATDRAGDDAPAAIEAAAKAHEFDRALDLATKTAALTPPPSELANALFTAGMAAGAERNIEPAAAFYRLLVDKFPESEHASAARAELAACYTYLRQLDACIAQCKVNLELDPKSRWVEYWEFLIPQSQFRLWRFEEAKAGLDAFLAKYPNGKYAKDARSTRSQIDPPWKISEDGVVAYTGKYDGDIRLQAAMKALPAQVEAGFPMLEKCLGVDLKPHTHVVYEFKDAGNSTRGGLMASTMVMGIQNKPVVVVRFYTEHVVAKRPAYLTTIVHEMKHAGFQGIMGQAYSDLPQWIREGLAVWGAEDVDDRLRMVLNNAIVAGKDPVEVLDGIDDPEHSDRDYMEDALAFEWLESKKAGNVKAFCQRLIKGEPYREIWADLSGMSYAEAMAEANAYCRSKVEAALGNAYPLFISIYKSSDAAMRKGADATKSWLTDGGKSAFEKWIASNSNHAATPWARFAFARVLITAGDYAQGRELLQHILDEDSQRCTLLDDAQFWIGVSYNKQRDAANARSAFGVLLRDYPYSQSAKQMAGKVPAAGPVTD